MWYLELQPDTQPAQSKGLERGSQAGQPPAIPAGCLAEGLLCIQAGLTNTYPLPTVEGYLGKLRGQARWAEILALVQNVYCTWSCAVRTLNKCS